MKATDNVTYTANLTAGFDNTPVVALTGSGTGFYSSETVVGTNTFAVSAPTQTNGTFSGNTAVQNFTVTNTGTASSPSLAGSFNISGAAGSGGSYAVSSSTCTGALAPNATCVVGVTFTATNNTGSAVTANLASSIPNVQTIALSGTAAGFNSMEAWQAPTAFAVNGASTTPATASQTLKLVNNGTIASPVPGTLALSGTNAAAYSLSGSTCTAALPPNGSCTVVVTLTDTNNVASQTATLTATIDTNPTVSLTGSSTGFAARETMAGSQSFSVTNPTPAGSSGGSVSNNTATQTYTVTNSGTLTGPSLSGSFSLGATTGTGGSYAISSNTCTTALAPGATCSVGVTFTAATNTTSAITSSLASSADTALSLSLSATASGFSSHEVFGTIAAFSVTAPTQSGGTLANNTSTKTVQLTNTGSSTSPNLSGAAFITGTNASAFSIASNTCTSTLAPGASCTIGVQMTPPTNGTYTATLNSSADNAPTVAMTGTASGFAAAFSVTPTSMSLSFTASPSGASSGQSGAAQNFTVRNTGTLTSVSLNGTFTPPSYFGLTNNNCTSTLAPNATCTVGVYMGSGSTNTSYSGNVTNSAGVPSVAVSGTVSGYGPVYTVTTSGLSFALQNPNTPTNGVINITNSGNQAGAINVAPSLSNTQNFSIVGNTCQNVTLQPSPASGYSCAISLNVMVSNSTTGAAGFGGNVSLGLTTSPNSPISVSGTANGATSDENYTAGQVNSDSALVASYSALYNAHNSAYSANYTGGTQAAYNASVAQSNYNSDGPNCSQYGGAWCTQQQSYLTQYQNYTNQESQYFYLQSQYGTDMNTDTQAQSSAQSNQNLYQSYFNADTARNMATYK
ncbi:MAG: beta strand repeat-containing protein [Janthinobacterium lividum]